MNQCKKDNSGWILCPSKRFPGKFYYFNVLNGEAAWSLNDAEQKALRKDNILQKADKSHSFPEPSTPPAESSTTNTGSNIQRTAPNINQSFKSIPQTTPIFGQAPFPSCVSTEPPTTNTGSNIQKTASVTNQSLKNIPQTRPIFGQAPFPSCVSIEPPTINLGSNIKKTVPNNTQIFKNIPQTTPMLGQAPFPPYVSNVEPFMQSILWAPIQLPMFSSKPWQNQATQSWEPDRDIFVQTCNIPLTKRFTNYEEPKTNILHPHNAQYFGQSSQNNEQPIKSSSNNYFTNAAIFGQTVHGQNNNDSIKIVGRQRTTSDPDSIFGTYYDNNGTFAVNNAQTYNSIGKNNNVDSTVKFARRRTLSESDSVVFEKPTNCNQPQSIFNPSFNYQKSSKENVESSEKNVQSKSFVLRKPVLNPSNKIHNTASEMKSTGQLEKDKKENTEWCNQNKTNSEDNKTPDKTDSAKGDLEKTNPTENKVDLLGNLDKTDLRFMLEEKRKKSADLRTLNSVEGNKMKGSSVNEKPKEPVKKRVMFDIASTEGSSEENQESSDNQTHVTIHTLRCLSDTTGHWYIAVDCNVLLEHYDFIDKFVQMDIECRLFVPRAVQSEIEEFCFGDCRGQQRVIVARQLTRRLAAPPPHIAVQPVDDEKEIFTKMSTIVRILYSCLQILHHNDHVVLLTDDSVLYEKAISLRIHCFKLKQIKDGALKPHGIFREPIKITLKNEATLQNQCQTSSNMDKKSDSYKKSFNQENTIKSCDVQTDIKTITDANTSPITFEETAAEKEKSRDYLNFNYDSDSEPTAISKTMEKLAIKDKNSNFLHKNSNNIVKLDDSKNNSSAFQIKNKINVLPQREYSGQSQNSKKESIFSEPKQNVPLQIQNKKTAVHKENQTTKKSKTEQIMVEQFKNSVGDKLKHRFQVISKLMADNIKSNIDEWICTYRQIMEYGLTASLQGNPRELPSNLPPPWTLHEAVTCIKKVFGFVWMVATLADELLLLLVNNCCKRGELKHDIEPEEFMRVFGCGVMLLENLQATDSCPAVREAQQLLYAMQALMTHGKEEVDLVRSPVLRRYEGEEPPRQNFSKKSSDIIQYLKNHFPAWYGYSEPSSTHVTDEVINHNDNKIVRTSGRNLNRLTINKAKSMTLKESTDKTNNDKRNPKQSTEINISENTLINSESTVKLYDKNEPKVIRIFDTSTPFPKKKTTNNTDNEISMTPKHGNTFGDKETGGPKVIRNIKLIDEFEEKLKSNEEACQSPNAESFSLTDVTLCTSINGNNDLCNDKMYSDHNNDDKISLIDNKHDLDKPNDSSTNDSGFVNESDTCTFLQTFLSDLSGTMKLMYGFINDSMAEFRKDNLRNDKKKSILEKATRTYGYLTKIIYELKCIVQRESYEVTPLKVIILKADEGVLGDRRMMRYRQVVMKCLEQAQIIEGTLKLLLGITEGDYDVTCITDKHTFLNIFE